MRARRNPHLVRGPALHDAEAVEEEAGRLQHAAGRRELPGDAGGQVDRAVVERGAEGGRVDGHAGVACDGDKMVLDLGKNNV